MMDPQEKLIVLSVVDGSPDLPVYGLINAWRVDSLDNNLRTLRHRLQKDFLPVAAFVCDPQLFLDHYRLLGFPQSMWLGWMGTNFGDALIAPDALAAFTRHYLTLGDGGAGLLAAWEIAAQFRDVG